MKKLEHAIIELLSNEETLQDFVFFFNRVENTRLSKSDIVPALTHFRSEDDTTVEDEYNLQDDGGKTGFMNKHKIESIYDAAVKKSGLKLSLSLQEFKRKYRKNLVRNDEWGEQYRELTQSYEEGDEIFELISPKWTWKQLCGHSFVALERKGKAVVVIRKSMS